jgi:gamma-glutamyltranspeptidase/glutathione hydrolase
MVDHLNYKPLIYAVSFTIAILILSGCQSETKLVTSNQTQLANEQKTQTDSNLINLNTTSLRNNEARAIPEAATTTNLSSKNSHTNSSHRMSVEAKKYMIAAANPLAAQAGLNILRAGGSAVDAAIAAQLALNVVEPQSSGIGGGAFLLHYHAASRAIEAYDGREKAPASATREMFLKSDGSPRKFYDVVPGGLSVGVPGLLRMLEMVHKKHGKLPWAKLFDPAIKLAEKGFSISPRLHSLVKIDGFLKSFKASKEYFYGSSDFAKPIGTKLINKPLAETFRQIAIGGADVFYLGKIGAEIVKTVREAPLNPGKITRSDLANYNAKKREPVCSFYRKWLICGMPPPTSGGITTIQILGLLQGTNIAKLSPYSTEAIHLFAEAGRLAFADRNKYLADEDFVPVPKSQLIDPGYLAERSKLISNSKSMGKARPGKIKLKPGYKLGSYQAFEGESTSHISIVDGEGNAVSMTSSIENAFGSRLMVGGFLLNNQLTDFSFLPKSNGEVIANRVEPNKRPRSSMSPMLVVDTNAKLVLAIGSPGGSRIIGYVAKTIIAALDWKMGIQDAITLPHFLNRNGTTDLEKGSKLEGLKANLEKLGHTVRVRKLTSGLHGITISKNGILFGGADPRREGVAIGD